MVAPTTSLRLCCLWLCVLGCLSFKPRCVQKSLRLATRYILAGTRRNHWVWLNLVDVSNPVTMSNLNKHKTAMKYNNLGASGLMVSELSFGCMTFTEGAGFLACGCTWGWIGPKDQLRQPRGVWVQWLSRLCRAPTLLPLPRATHGTACRLPLRIFR